MHKRLNGSVALVTGAGRGIGRSIALKLADEGAHLVVNDLDAAPLDELLSELQARGAQAVGVAGSVSAPDFPERLVGAALERFGEVDILVNNAGYIWNSRIETTTDEQWNAMLDVHLGAPFRIVRHLARHWKDHPLPPAPEGVGHHRKIVNVSSVSGTHGAFAQIAYSAAKAGLVGLTLSLARELGPQRVNVNAVAFGLIETRLTQEIQGETRIAVGEQTHRVGLTRAMLDDYRARIPLRRGGTPDEAAGGVLLLCLPESNYVTGQVLEVDGGLAI
jgi:3-oxoacyl-[acyl-carrier protein] reductase